MKLHWKLPSAKWRLFCIGLIVLMQTFSNQCVCIALSRMIVEKTISCKVFHGSVNVFHCRRYSSESIVVHVMFQSVQPNPFNTMAPYLNIHLPCTINNSQERDDW